MKLHLMFSWIIKKMAAHLTLKMMVIAAIFTLYLPYGYAGTKPDNREFAIEKSEIAGSMSGLPTHVELVDNGDFYFINTGEKISFLRHKKTYLTIFHKAKKDTPQIHLNRIDQFQQKVDIIQGRFSDKYTLFQVKEGENPKAIIANILEADASIKFISPILTRKAGRDEIAITPTVIVSIKEGEDNDIIVENLETKYNLSVVTKLSFSNSEYEFNINEEIADIGQIFAITREIADMSYIEWVEPNFLATPEKMAFIPNDTLFNNQWHLNNNRDADIDAPEGWDISTGNNTIIAVVDEAVELLHPDLTIWSNPGETGLDGVGNDKRINGIDDDGNGYIDDHQGWDFSDGDNNPGPGVTGERHGTAVAGVSGATGNNSVGVTGTAMNAETLPIRISTASCSDLANAIRYGGRYADVVNNSWGWDSADAVCQSNLNTAIADVVHGNIADARRGTNGSPVLFASGNGASGWIKFTVPLTMGMHNFRWSFIKDATDSEGFDTVWLDDIDWGFGGTTDFNGENVGVIPAGFTSTGVADWLIVNDGIHARGSTGNSVRSGSISHNQQTDLVANRTVGGGGLTFWVWVSCEAPTRATSTTPSLIRDRFEFFADGNLVEQYAPGQYGTHDNDVSYPASNPDTIAVGASNDGVWSGREERSSYSQFGSTLDVVAPSSGGVERITTTDRLGVDGYNTGGGGDLADTNYTERFGGTSSAAPLVSGVVASLISYKNTLTTSEIRTILHNGTDKIGPYSYVSGRNDYYGYGRINFPMIVGQKWVDFSYSGQETGSPDKAFNTLGEGINSVPEGGLIVIRNGTTTETPVITKRMTIKAVGGAVTIGE
jgi:subtilisin family serine protease